MVSAGPAAGRRTVPQTLSHNRRTGRGRRACAGMHAGGARPSPCAGVSAADTRTPMTRPGNCLEPLTLLSPLLKGAVSRPAAASRGSGTPAGHTRQVSARRGEGRSGLGFGGSSGRRAERWRCSPVAPQLEQVVGAAQQLPLRLARPKAATQEPPGPADLLELAEDRLHGLLPLGVAGPAILQLQQGGHRRAQPVAARGGRPAVLAGLALPSVLGARDQQLRRVRELGEVGDGPIAGVRQHRTGPLSVASVAASMGCSCCRSLGGWVSSAATISCSMVVTACAL